MAKDDFLNELEDDLRRAEIGCTVSMYLMFLQQKNIWPCSMKLGECPAPITTEELAALLDEFKNLSVPQSAGG